MITEKLKAYYKSLKEKHDALLLFRINDYYYSLGDDAEKTASATKAILTEEICEKGEPIKCARFPHWDLDTFLPRLIRAGNRVAIHDL